jgi:ABC-type sugar transport system ATPase subunit
VALLQTVNLRKQFGETRACDGVNFVVRKGEFLSLVGSNGAGKTSLVNLISAHLQPDSGQILFEDKDITFTTVTERIKIGIARSFQIVNLFDGLSVFDNVALSIFSRDGKTVKIASLADRDDHVRREAFEVLCQFGLQGMSEVLQEGLHRASVSSSTSPWPMRCGRSYSFSMNQRVASALTKRHRLWTRCRRSYERAPLPRSSSSTTWTSYSVIRIAS